MVYESIYDETIPVPFYFTSKIHLAYRSYFSHFDKGKEILRHGTVHQCYYCQNVFAKSKENVKKYLSVCSAKEGITYAFDNG